MKRLALIALLTVTACADWPPAPPTLSVLVQNGVAAYQPHAFERGYFATDLAGRTYAYAWLERDDEFDVQLTYCSPLGCTTSKRYGQNPLHAALTVCREAAGGECTILLEGARRR